MRFKHPELAEELARAHPRLVAIALYADWWANRDLERDLVVTDVSRTQAEYDAIYADKMAEGMYFVGADGVKHYSGPRPHLEDPLHGIPGHAIDFRSTGELNATESKRLVDHLNANWPRTDGKKTALVHDVGQGLHVHVQAQV